MSSMQKGPLVQIWLDKQMFMTVIEILYHVKLGNDNKFESAISDIVCNEALDEMYRYFITDTDVPAVKVVKYDDSGDAYIRLE